jgi:hypothetical protein
MNMSALRIASAVGDGLGLAVLLVAIVGWCIGFGG